MDKTNEEDLDKAVTNPKLLLEPHDLWLMDFTSRVDSSSFPVHYVLYWELGSKIKDMKLKPEKEERMIRTLDHLRLRLLGLALLIS
ncbi:Indole-3-acetic acid-amido synthetase GH3.15 [Cardamine amara subsp. amara]|uniref:Indole-3-acetic acid-amido synthetase GH3.15 n=1 Tax=Cardamine amara subsp. amara TaxID=228776 RepID=A0ABD1BEU2_CARAN